MVSLRGDRHAKVSNFTVGGFYLRVRSQRCLHVFLVTFPDESFCVQQTRFGAVTERCTCTSTGAGGTRSFGEHTPSPFESTAVQAEHVNPFVSAYVGVGQSQKDPFQSQTSPPSPFESTLPQSSPFASFAQARSPFESRSVALG